MAITTIRFVERPIRQMAEINIVPMPATVKYVLKKNLPKTADRSELIYTTDTHEIYHGDGIRPLRRLSDVEIYSDKDKFPKTGVSNKIYIDTNSGFMYYWNGEEYEVIRLDESSITSLKAVIQQISQHVADLQTSYDAFKVITDIAKDDGVNHYNVNEVLHALRTAMDVLQLELEQNVDETKVDLQAKIDNINNTPIKDRVRLLGTINQNGDISFDDDVNTLIPEVINDSRHSPYYVYTLDNQPLMDQFGGNISFDFDTGLLSDIPHKLDETNTEQKIYIPITEVTRFKVFPVGLFTFSSLPTDYLIDNEELNLIAYSNAIDDIVWRLAKNDELIEDIKIKVAHETIRQHITLITDNLQAQINQNKNNITSLTIVTDLLQSQINQINSDIQMIEGNLDSLQTEVDQSRTDFETADSQLEQEINQLRSVQETSDVFTVTEPTQTVFNLSHTPTLKKVRAIINRLLYKEGEDFTVDRVLKTATWTSTAANEGFDLTIGFNVEFIYVTTEKAT